MKTDLEPRVTDAQRMTDGVIISFEDGKCAFYSAALLYEAIDQAEPFREDERYLN